MNLIRRAIKERWPIPKGVRPKLAKRLQEALEQEDDIRSVIAAARALLEADKLNMEQEKRDAAIPERLDITSGGKTIDRNSLTPDDLAATIRLVDAARNRLQAERGPEPLDT